MNMVWIDGALWPAERARIDPTDRGFTLGDGIFETIRAEHSEPLHFGRHVARLRASAAFFEIPVPFSDPVLYDALRNLAARIEGFAALRLTLTRGPAARGVLPANAPCPTCLITAAALPPAAPIHTAIVASITRRNEHSPLSRHKTLNYLDAILARQEAARRNAGEAILLNTAGRLAEATAACLFLRLGTDIFTPPVADGALPGIARALMLESGEAVEKSLTLQDLRRADSVFTANALGRRAMLDILA